MFDAEIDNNRIVLVPVKMTPISATLESIRDKMGKLGISEADISEAIARTRKKKK